MERRNFVSVVPAAKKSKLGPIFFQNIRVIYKLSMKKQKTGEKTKKKPPKKVFFPAWLDMVIGQTISGLYGPDQIQPGWIWSDHIQPQAGYGLTISRQTEPAGRRGWKNTFLGGFFSVFCPVFCFFIDNLYVKCLFCKKNRSD